MLRSIYRFTSSLSTASVSSPLAVLFPPSVEYLVTSLSLSQADVNKITKNHGHIENMSIEQLSTKLSFLASPPLNLTTPEQRFLILRIPQILTASSSLLSSKLDFFRSKFTLNSTELRKIIIKNPHVLTCSVCSNELKFDYLTTRLDLTNEQLRKILFRQPQVLSCSIATNLSPTISFLESRLELSAAELRTVILQVRPHWERWCEQRAALFASERRPHTHPHTRVDEGGGGANNWAQALRFMAAERVCAYAGSARASYWLCVVESGTRTRYLRASRARARRLQRFAPEAAFFAANTLRF